MDPSVLDTLRLLNPWLDEPGTFPGEAAARLPVPWIERLAPQVLTWPVPRQAHLVVGARQVGKSSLIWHWLVDHGHPPLFVNCEELSLRGWARSPARMAADVRALVLPSAPLFLDEAQHLEDAGLLVKGLVDSGLPNPILVSGSSGFHLLSRTRESLAGRATRLVMHPFSVAELAATVPGGAPLLRARRLHELCLRHAVIGGYPAAWVPGADAAVARRLVDALVIRDASDLFRVENLDAFRRLLHLLAGQVGSLVNASEWAALCGISRETVSRYLDVLVESGIVHVVPPFAGGKRAELTGRPKVYVSDTGIGNALLRREAPFAEREDRGPLLEAWVGGELRKHLSALDPLDSIRFWRSTSGAEVDFVLAQPGRLLAVEVKASPLSEPRLSRSTRSFIEAYAPAEVMVLNLALEAEAMVGSTRVRWCRPEAMIDVRGWIEGGTSGG